MHQKLVTRAHLLELSGRCILLKFKNAMNFCSGLFIASHTGYDSYGRCNCTCIGVPYLTVLLLVSEQWAVLAFRIHFTNAVQMIGITLLFPGP